MERARCFFTGDLIFTHVFNTQPQPGVPQRRWPVSFFLLEAAGCRIQTANPSVSESSNNICQVTSQQFSLTFVLEMDFILETSSKKSSAEVHPEGMRYVCVLSTYLCVFPVLSSEDRLLVFPPSDFTITLLLSDSEKPLFYCSQLSFHGFLDTLRFSADGLPSEPVPKCDSAFVVLSRQLHRDPAAGHILAVILRERSPLSPSKNTS